MKTYPFIGYSLAFIGGILTNYFLNLDSHFMLIPLILLFIISIIGYFNRINVSVGLIFKISFYFFFFVLGNFLFALKIESKSFLSDEIKSVDKLVVIGSIQNIDLLRNNELTFQIKSDSIRIDNVYYGKKVFLLCKVKDELQDLKKIYSAILPGNIVRIEGTFHTGREKRNPGEFDYDMHLRFQGISGIIYVKDEYDVKILSFNSNYFKSLIYNVRKLINLRINSLHNSEAAGLLRGLLLADRSGIDYETKTEFVNSGVIHILAVSGLHVGYIILIFLFVFGRFNIFIKSILTMFGLIVFLLITGMPASVFRAVTMAVVIIFAYLTNRSSNIFNSLAIAAFILLAVNPEELFSAGFQLSFSAVLSIAVIYPILQKYIYSLKINSNVLNFILLFMGVSLSAQIGTIPLTMIYFGKLSLVSIFTNLIVIPLAGIIVGVGIFTLCLSLFISSLAIYFALANEFIIFLLFKIIAFTGGSVYSFIHIRDFSIYDAVIFYSMLILLLTGLNKIYSPKGKLIFISLLIANAILISSFDNKNLLAERKLSLMMVDVSKGDAALIKFPNGETALLNGGHASFYFDNGKRIITPLLNYLGIDKIDYAFVSSLTQEHLGGIVYLIQSGLIKNAVKPELDTSIFADVKLEELLKLKNTSIRYFEKGTMKIGDVRIYFLNSKFDNFTRKNLSINNSGVFKIVFGNTSFLFPGNIENDEEYFFSEKYKEFLKSDVLLVSNNGKNISSSLQFLQAIKPRISLISVGNQNKFDYPSPYILDRLKKSSTEVYRTDEEGAILLQSDGVEITKVNWK